MPTLGWRANLRNKLQSRSKSSDRIWPSRIVVRRLRYFLHRDPALVGRVLAVALRALEGQLRACCPGAPVMARFGAVTFI